MRKSILLAAGLGLAASGFAEAHVGIAPSEVPVGTTVIISLGIGHGCDGSPTTAVRLQLPAGVISVQPVAKPGWDIEVIRGAYATPHMNGETEVAEGVLQVNWTGGSLPEELYDTFDFRARLASGFEPGTQIAFPVVQECAEGVHRWLDIPVAGAAEPDEPAPTLTVAEPVAEAGHQH